MKIREGKPRPAARHAARAAALFGHIARVPDPPAERVLGMTAMALAEHAEAAGLTPLHRPPVADGRPEAVFGFVLGSPALP